MAGKASIPPGAATVSAAKETAKKLGDFTIFETDEQLTHLHQVLLMMIKDFSSICQQEEITWIASYGTAIGALRHQGFIPWDDDIDICMLRSDLNKLVDYVLRNKNSKYGIVNTQINPNYPLATTRFYLKGTEFRDSALIDMQFPSGIFLDLFALDTLSEKPLAGYLQTYGSWFFNKLAIAKSFSSPTITRSGLQGQVMKIAASAAKAILNAPLIRIANPNNIALNFLLSHSKERPKKVGYTCDTFATTCLYDIDDLLPVRWVPFEDTTIPIAAHAEKLLDEYYGNWLQLPPGNARKMHYPEVLDFGTY